MGFQLSCIGWRFTFLYVFPKAQRTRIVFLFWLLCGIDDTVINCSWLIRESVSRILLSLLHCKLRFPIRKAFGMLVLATSIQEKAHDRDSNDDDAERYAQANAYLR